MIVSRLLPPPDATRALASATLIRTARARWCGAVASLLLVAQAAGAQAAPPRPDSVSVDSLAARLARAEASIALLREQLATETSTQVRLRSRIRMDLHARLLTNAFYTSNEASNPEIPLFAKSAGASSAEYGSAGGRAMGLSVRQTTMGGSVSVDSVLGGTFGADFELDFFGGNTTDAATLFPPPRLRTARGFMRWEKTELMVGADTPLISDLDPMSTSAIAIPDFSTAGNLWNWLPQVRVTREVGVVGVGDRAVHWALQGAVITPFSGEKHPTEPSGIDAGLRSARPYLEARLRAQWGTEHEPSTSQRIGDRGGEMGIGTHRGWLRVNGDTLTSSWAVSADARIGLTHGLELRGEAYRGRLLRGLGGGGIGQNFGRPRSADDSGDPLTDTAGWLQLNAQLRPSLIVGMGCGTDRVHDGLPARQRNTACATHLAWRPASPVLFGVEYRNIATRGPGGVFRTSHFNMSFGIEL